MASDKAATDAQGARKLGRASYIVSTVGIFVSIIVIAIYLGVFFGVCRYNYNGACFRFFDPFMTRSECYARDGVFHNGCYYN